MGLTYIASVTASASATVSFTTGIDSTYNEYQFHFVNMHPATDSVNFGFQVNAVGASGFNETITSTAFNAHLRENNTGSILAYQGGSDQSQGTAYQRIGSRATGNDNDQSTSGILTLYAPASTTYVKHFVSSGNGGHSDDYTLTMPTAGYINTTSAIDEISFKFDSGNIDSGTIHMYGVG